MKHSISFLASLILLAGAFSSCQKEEPASLSVLQDKYEVDFAGESTTIGVACNRDWTAEVDVDWISLTPSKAEAFEAKSYMIIKVERNDKGLPRTGIVTIKSDDGALSQIITVIQKENGEIISTVEQFVDYLNKVEAQTASDTYKLDTDLDLAGITLPEVKSMIYKFDGGGHKISNWATSKPLFNAVAASGTVSNLVFDNTCKYTLDTDAAYYGFITIVNEGTISGIISGAPVEVKAFGKTVFGAICGQNKGTVSECGNDADIVFSGAPHTAGSAYIAGVVGQNSGEAAKVINCINTGKVSLTFSDVLGQSIYAAGVVGTNNSNAHIQGCSNKGNVNVACKGCKTNGQAAGIVCYAGGEVADCNNSGAITFISESAEGKADGQVKGTGVAGIACYMGWANGVMKSCSNSGAITLRAGYPIGYQTVGSATKYATNVGGVVAHAYNCSFEDCTNTGKVLSEIKQIDKSPADGYQTTARHAVAGIVASSWGDITNCVNEGEIAANWITSTHNAALAKNFVMMAGGITGGSYNGNLTKESKIISCKNKGAVTITCDSSGSNNNAGGIVGWSSNEAANTAVIEGCENSGAVTHDGFGKVRFGGIAGAGSTLKGCKNSGKVWLKGATTSSCVGGVLGWLNFNGVIGCTNTGEVQSDINITNALAASGANYSSQSGIGGIVGGHGNTDVVFTGNAVNCKVSAPSGCKFASMVIGMTDRDKTAAAGKALNVGTKDSPIKVKGNFCGTELTASNYTSYIKYTGVLNLNTAVVYNTVFGE